MLCCPRSFGPLSALARLNLRAPPSSRRLYNQWFQLADTDRDGVLSGAEAVQFFLRSGLPKHPTLFKVWQYVAGDRPALSRQEFYTAMKLVSLAQVGAQGMFRGVFLLISQRERPQPLALYHVASPPFLPSLPRRPTAASWMISRQ